MSNQGPIIVAQNYWAVYVYYSSHTEESTAFSAREAQEQILPLLQECDPGYACAVTVEMRAGDNFHPAYAPEDRRGYFVTAEDGSLKMVDRESVYKVALAAYNVRARREE